MSTMDPTMDSTMDAIPPEKKKSGCKLGQTMTNDKTNEDWFLACERYEEEKIRLGGKLSYRKFLESDQVGPKFSSTKGTQVSLGQYLKKYKNGNLLRRKRRRASRVPKPNPADLAAAEGTAAIPAKRKLEAPPISSPCCKVYGRVFIITGGTQGLGLEIARQLKSQGASGLVLVSRSADRGEEACKELSGDPTADDTVEGGAERVASSSDQRCKCVFVRADLSSGEDASSVVPRASELMSDVGPITGIVNAAATTERGNLLTTSADDFDRQMAVNVRAPFLITQAAANHMADRNVPGSIVNICSVAANAGAPFIMAYSCAKSALVTLTKNNAAELAPRRIRVNAINMGWTLTENEDKLQSAQTGDEKWVEKADKKCPLGRILRVSDVASSVCFLLSNASAMMTGSVIDLHPEYSNGILSHSTEDKRT